MKLFQQKFALSVGLILVFTCFATCNSAEQEKRKRNIVIQAGSAVEAGDWAKVLEISNRLLERTMDEQVKGIHRPLLIQYTKYALVHTGELLENFFAYSKYIGFHEMLPKHWDEVEILGDPVAYLFFRDIGLQTSAMALAFNRFDSHENPSDLSNFIRSAIIAGDYRAAQTAVNRLKQYRKWQRQAHIYNDLLTDTNLINDDPYYAAMRKLSPKSDFLINFIIDHDVNLLIGTKDDYKLAFLDNQRAVEYAFLTALLRKAYIFPEIDLLLEQFDYDHIPKHLEEAILVYTFFENPIAILNNVGEWGFGFEKNLKIRPKTIQRFKDFLADFEDVKSGSISPETFDRMYEDTYQFYYWFFQLPI
jgi:hypothetical protein